MRAWRKLSFAVLFVLVFISAGFVLFLLTHTQKTQFPDGSSLEWLGTTQGTNVFLEGSVIEKIFGNHIPVKGIDLLGLQFKRPRTLYPGNETDLTCWLRLRSPVLRASDFKYYWEGSRVAVSNRSGRAFANPSARPNRILSNEVILAVPLHAFPRNEKKVQLSVIPPGQKTNPPGAAQFEFKNPFPAAAHKWKSQSLPATNNHDGVNFSITEARALPKIEIQFALSASNWYLAECRIRDEENNGFSWHRMGHPSEKTFSVSFEYGLDPSDTWKVDATFIRAAGFPASPPSNFNDEEKSTLQISSTGPEVRLTNAIGETHIWRFDGRELTVRREKKNDRPYWVILSSTNELDKPVTWGGGSAWSGSFHGQQSQVWWIEKPGSASNLSLQLACPKIVGTTFYIKPTAPRSNP